MTTTQEKGTAMAHTLDLGTAGYYRCTCKQTFVTVEDFIAHRDGSHEEQAKDRFMKALSDFYSAGMRLVEAWDDVDFNADDLAPLPARLAPPLSLDEWLIELTEHYEAAFSVDPGVRVVVTTDRGYEVGTEISRNANGEMVTVRFDDGTISSWLVSRVAPVSDEQATEGWEKDGDPCNDCGQPANYSEAAGWYYHVDPDAPPCFLMGSGPIEGHNDPIQKEESR